MAYMHLLRGKRNSSLSCPMLESNQLYHQKEQEAEFRRNRRSTGAACALLSLFQALQLA